MLTRLPKDETAVLTNSASTTATFDFSEYTSIVLDIPSSYSSTSVAVHKWSKLGVWLPLHDKDGTAITATIAAGKSTVIDAGVFGCSLVRFVTNNSADNAKIVGVTLKA